MEKEASLELIQTVRKYLCIRHQAVEKLFSDFPLQDPAQYFLLIGSERLRQGDVPPSQQDLAASTHRSPSTIAASLKVLERRGLIRRLPDRDDQRIKRVELTKAGSAVTKGCREKMTELELQGIHGLSQEEIRQLTFLLGKMNNNFCEILYGKKEEQTID